MANIVLRASTRNIINGRAELLMRFYGSRKVDQRARTYIYAPSATWSDKEQRIITPKRCSAQELSDARKIQTQIEELSVFVMNRFMEDEPVISSRDWLQHVVDDFYHVEERRAAANKTVQDMIREYLTQTSIQDVTAKQFTNLINILDRFEAKNGPLLINSLSSSDLNILSKFMRSESIISREGYGKTKETADKEETTKRCQNTVNTKMRRLRTAVKWWAGQEEGRKNPFDKFKIEQDVYGTPIWLTFEERDAIYSAHMPNEDLAIQRDIFCFQCSIGCRVSDLTTFTQSNISEDGFLEYVQHKLRRKNPVTVRVPLSDMAKDIIERYKGQPGGKLLPCTSDQEYNRAIKKVLRAAGINRIVMVQDKLTYESIPTPICDIASSHLARRTFCANLYKQTKSERIVSSMSGHVQGSRAFARYSEVDDEMKMEAIENKKRQPSQADAK